MSTTRSQYSRPPSRRGPLDPGPFDLPGGEVGALLIHGFTGAPPEMRLLGDHLADCGLTVVAPRLPGHGTDPADLAGRRWEEWLQEAEDAWQALAARCETTVVGGLSMGALLALELGARHPEIAGLMAYAPALWVGSPLIRLTPWLKYLVATWPKPRRGDLFDPGAESRAWCYDVRPVAATAELLALQRHARAELSRVRQPLLIVQSTRDETIQARCGPELKARVASEEVELRWLHRSGHNILVDGEWFTVARWTVEALQRWLGPLGGGAQR